MVPGVLALDHPNFTPHAPSHICALHISHAISHLEACSRLLSRPCVIFPRWHAIYSQGIIPNSISSTNSLLIPAAESNCCICTLTALCLDLSSTLSHLLPTTVIISVVCRPYEAKGFLRVELCLTHLCASPDFQGPKSAWHSLAKQTINILRQSSSIMCWFIELSVCVLAVSQGAWHRPQTQYRMYHICVGITSIISECQIFGDWFEFFCLHGTFVGLAVSRKMKSQSLTFLQDLQPQNILQTIKNEGFCWFLTLKAISAHRFRRQTCCPSPFLNIIRESAFLGVPAIGISTTVQSDSLLPFQPVYHKPNLVFPCQMPLCLPSETLKELPGILFPEKKRRGGGGGVGKCLGTLETMFLLSDTVNPQNARCWCVVCVWGGHFSESYASWNPCHWYSNMQVIIMTNTDTGTCCYIPGMFMYFPV